MFIWDNLLGLFNWIIISWGYLQKGAEHHPSFFSGDIKENKGCSSSSDDEPTKEYNKLDW